MSGGLIQLAGVVVDFVHVIDRLPAPGEEVETRAFRMTAGGGFNAMAAARRMGAHVTYGGVLGQGPLADIARIALAEEGIDLATDRRAEMDQGSCAVIVDASGERSFITHHGAERAVDFPHLAALPASSHRFALLSGYSLYKPESAAAFLSWLPRLARPPLIVFDPGPIIAEIPRDTLDRTVSRADWISANAVEARQMTGETDPARAVALLATGRLGAVVRVGANGCWLHRQGRTAHVPGFSVEARDTNGAGDAHDGAFIAAMIAGFDADDAALIANAAAAISTTIIGPATAPDARKTRQFLESRGVQLARPQHWERAKLGASDAHHEEDRT